MKFSLMVGKAILNLKANLSRLETADDKLMNAFDAKSDSEAATT